MKLKKVEMNDFNDIQKIYIDIIEKTTDMEKYACWKKGMHPTDAAIMEYIKSGSMYLYTSNAKIAGVLAVTMEQEEDYHEITWGIEAGDTEVAVIHILGVNSEYQKQGIGSQMIEEVLELARAQGKKAVRLDALTSNIPAQHMYQKNGFVYRGTRNQYAENTGWTDFYFYEYIL